MTDKLTLPQLRAVLDGGRFSILPDDDAGYWIRLRPSKVKAAFNAGLAPFSALEAPITVGLLTYTLPRGTLFVPLRR